MKQMLTLMVVSLAMLAAFAMAQNPGSAPASKPAASAPAGNVVTGMLVAKGEDWISVKAEGQDKGTRFAAKGADVIGTIGKLTIPSRVKVVWKQDGEDKQIVSVQTVAQVSTEGVVEGTVAAKGDNWIDVKPAEGGEAERYLTYGDANAVKDVKATIAGLAVGDKVKVTWKHIERKRVMKLEKVGG